MKSFFSARDRLETVKAGPILRTTGWEGRLVFLVHTNPDNIILHSALVGEWNGVLAVLDPQEPLAVPRRYSRFVQTASGLPARRENAQSGSAVFAQVRELSGKAREDALVAELLAGNMPDFLRRFQPVTLGPLVCAVAPDYLAVGSDSDYIRAPLTPMSAHRLARAFDCLLPTPRLVDAIYQQATVQLDPHPLTENREATATFALHSRIIDAQRGNPSGGPLTAGCKKDLVLTNRLVERPGRVAIYGWHRRDGRAIQPLSTVHQERYVDYSHGVRLIRRKALLDGKPCDLLALLHHPSLSRLLSDEGPLV